MCKALESFQKEKKGVVFLVFVKGKEGDRSWVAL